MKGVTAAFSSCLFFGLYPVFNKVLVGEIAPLALAAITSVFAGLLLLAILGVKHRVGEIAKLSLGQAIMLATVALFGGVIAQVLFLNGLMESTATNAALLTRVEGLLMALLGVIVLKEKVTSSQIMGTGVMVFGTAVIVTKAFTASVQFARGDLLIVLASGSWALANIIMKKNLSDISPELVIVTRHLMAGIILMMLVGTHIPLDFDGKAWLHMSGLVVFVLLIGQYLWYFALEHTSAANVAMASLATPLLGVVYSVVLLGETLSSYQIWGGALMVAGLAMVEIHMGTIHNLEHRIRSLHLPIH